MIYDLTAFLGAYDRRSVGVEAESLARSLENWAVQRVFAGRIDILLRENVNQAQVARPPVRFGNVTVETVPSIDPTLPDWSETLARQFEANGSKLPVVRLHPGHHGYAIDDDAILAPVVDWTHHHGSVIQVILDIDDPRRRHPATKLKDASVPAIGRLAKHFPQQKFLASGAAFAPLAALAREWPPNLWADTARVEAAAGLARLFDAGVGDRLVFASFAPLLITHSAIARVLADLNDPDASKVMRRNAEALLAAV